MRVSDKMIKLVRAEPDVYTQSELSRRFDVTRERIRQITKKHRLHVFLRHRKEHKAKFKIAFTPIAPPKVTKDNMTRKFICPRCTSPLILEKDEHGWYENCILCGCHINVHAPNVGNKCLELATSGDD